MRSEGEVKTELDQRLTTTMTENEPQSGFGSITGGRGRTIQRNTETFVQGAYGKNDFRGSNMFGAPNPWSSRGREHGW